MSEVILNTYSQLVQVKFPNKIDTGDRPDLFDKRGLLFKGSDNVYIYLELSVIFDITSTSYARVFKSDSEQLNELFHAFAQAVEFTLNNENQLKALLEML